MSLGEDGLGKVDGLIASVFIREKGSMPYTIQPGFGCLSVLRDAFSIGMGFAMKMDFRP